MPAPPTWDSPANLAWDSSNNHTTTHPNMNSHRHHCHSLTMRILLSVAAAAFASIAVAADDRFPPVACASTQNVKLRGPLGQRYTANTAYLQWRYRDADRLLFPFEHRDQWQRVRDWDGEYIGKWLDAAVLTADATRDAALLAAVDEAAKRLRATQEADGYLGTELPANRLKPGWPLWMHWLAAKSLREHGQRRGDDASVKAAIRGADWVLQQFGTITDGKNPIYRASGHLSVLDELVEIHAITGDRKYLDFGAAAVAHYPPFQNMRQTYAVGQMEPMHCYSLMTYLGGAVRLAVARGDKTELEWLERVWTDIATRRLFPTASVSIDEGFKAPPADLPNAHLQETCATVEWILFSHRLYLATGDVRYANMIERTVRNALLGAQSTDGLKWTYFTPLREIKDWFAGPTDCCYFSGPRGIARLPELVYHADAGGVRVDLFEDGEAVLNVEDARVKLTQTTDYPAGGEVKITVDVDRPLAFTLKVRIPEHVTGARVAVGAEPPRNVEAGRHAELRREWRAGDSVTVSFEPETWLAALSDGSAAIVRGAEVLALDRRDNPAMNFGTVRLLPGLPVLEPAEPSSDRDHRARYRCQLEVAGKPAAVLLTPFAVAGNLTPGVIANGAVYRTAFPRTVPAAPEKN